MNKSPLLALALFAGFAVSATDASARDQIRIVGSSTVYPFVSAAAENFGKTSGFKTPIVESTGTGGGFKLFCEGNGDATPDIEDASRKIEPSERDACTKAGVKDPQEVKIGYDGIVLANTKGAPLFHLTKKQIFFGLARQIPVGGKLVANSYTSWKQVDASLPDQKIEVYGPPPTSGTRDSFGELVMEHVCKNLPEFVAAYKDEKERGKACRLLREDGAYVEAGENDNIIVQKLKGNPTALGIFGYSFLEENRSQIQGSTIDGIAPTFDTIANGTYAIARPLFIYVKREHVGAVPGLKEFVREVASEKAMGDSGYMVKKGLVPLPKAERASVEASVAK